MNGAASTADAPPLNGVERNANTMSQIDALIWSCADPNPNAFGTNAMSSRKTARGENGKTSLTDMLSVT